MNPLEPPYIDWFRVPLASLDVLLKDSDYTDLQSVELLIEAEEDIGVTSDDNVFFVSDLVVDPHDEGKVLYTKKGLYIHIYKLVMEDKDCGC
jgi:hypothetical protein